MKDGSDWKARIFGDAAIVTGSHAETSSYKGEDTSGTYRWTDVFVRRDGRWQVVSSHNTKVVHPR